MPEIQELLRLPAVTPGVGADFERALAKSRSEKDQRNLIKRLLFNSGAPGRACCMHCHGSMNCLCTPLVSANEATLNALHAFQADSTDRVRRFG